MIVTEITVEPKKGASVRGKWGVWQARPHPDTEWHGGSLNWRNHDGLFPRFGKPGGDLAAVYNATLLREGYEADNAKHSRLDYAGYVPYLETDPLPGAITYRGRTLGEVTAEILLGSQWGGAQVTFRVRGGETPTENERAFLSAQVAPGLLSAVSVHAAEQRAEAIAGLRDTFAGRIFELEKSIRWLREQSDACLLRLETR